MPVARLNGVWLRYEVAGEGELVGLVMGTGSPGRVWQLHQVPALVAAGYRVATFDSRGVMAGSRGDAQGGPEAGIEGLTIDDMVGDVAALVEHLGGGPARVVGHVLGEKIRIGKYKKRTGYRLHNGFRSRLTQIEIEAIGGAGRKTAAKKEAPPRAEAAPKPEAAAPKAEECISYGIPAFRLNRRLLVFFGAWSNHCAFYPGSAAALKKFRDELRNFHTRKGTIRFSPDQPLPVAFQ